MCARDCPKHWRHSSIQNPALSLKSLKKIFGGSVYSLISPVLASVTQTSQPWSPFLLPSPPQCPSSWNWDRLLHAPNAEFLLAWLFPFSC